MASESIAVAVPRNDEDSAGVLRVDVPGPIIVGAGPSGLAVAAALRLMSVPAVVLERSDGLAHLWRHRSYDRLSLHLPKRFCQLPHLPFPHHFPAYPTKAHFLSYLHHYAHRFSVDPLFGREVVSARFDPAASAWRVTTAVMGEVSSPPECGHSPAQRRGVIVEYVSRWLVVAAGENAEAAVPEVAGKGGGFEGSAVHSSEYKNGVGYKGQRVLVVGCGNSGMEVCLDLWEHGALPFMSVRTGVHVLPREILGASTFGVAMKLLKLLPTRIVDRILLLVARLALGDTEKYGLRRPETGPLEHKLKTGKTPVLDVGTFPLIKNGSIKIMPEVESLTSNGAKFVDGTEMGFDSVIFATGYRSNVPSWLKDTDLFSEEGKPRAGFRGGGWKGENGLYSVGFTGKGLLGAGTDAQNIAFDIAGEWKQQLSEKTNSILSAPTTQR